MQTGMEWKQWLGSEDIREVNATVIMVMGQYCNNEDANED